MESTRIETERLRELLAADVEWTADLQEGADATADLPNESIAEPMPTTENDRSNEIDPLAQIPQQHAFGFFAFAACAVSAILIEIQEPTESSPPTAAVALAGGSLAMAAAPSWSQPAGIPADSSKVERRAETRPAQSVSSKHNSSGAGETVGVVTFDARTFATSEKAVAAVFIVRRTRDVRGRAVVQWAARSGSADAGIDFSDASGTVRFADGQRQRAIYVPLRNDLLTEEDETFTVCLRAPRQARISGTSCAEVTIRDDDDGTSQT